MISDLHTLIDDGNDKGQYLHDTSSISLIEATKRNRARSRVFGIEALRAIFVSEVKNGKNPSPSS